MRSSKSALFLMELIIVIAFFALASAVCMRLFVHAHLVSKQSADLNMAVGAAQSAAECLRAADGDLERMTKLIPGAQKLGENEMQVLYGKNWEPGGGDYRLSLYLTREGGIVTGRIYVRGAADEELYSLLVDKYIPGLEGS